MALTQNDLKLISEMLDGKLEQKFTQFEARLRRELKAERRQELNQLRAERKQELDELVIKLFARMPNKDEYVTKAEFQALKDDVNELKDMVIDLAQKLDYWISIFDLRLTRVEHDIKIIKQTIGIEYEYLMDSSELADKPPYQC